MIGNYAHIEKDENKYSLHDCYANKIEFAGGILSFYFEDGFWSIPDVQSNPDGEIIKTTASRVDFTLEFAEDSDVCVYVFTEKRSGRVIREQWQLDRFMRSINSGEFRLEFLYQYKGYNSRIIDCCLWFDKKPYHKECQLYISETGVSYCWNDLRPEKVW